LKRSFYPDATQNIAYLYDEADSLTGCSGSSPVGRLTRVIENNVSKVFCYDTHGNVIRKAHGCILIGTSRTITIVEADQPLPE
jgi:hypothetical protein